MGHVEGIIVRAIIILAICFFLRSLLRTYFHPSGFFGNLFFTIFDTTLTVVIGIQGLALFGAVLLIISGKQSEVNNLLDNLIIIGNQRR